MSHFTVAVITAKKEKLEEMLAPYDEELEVEPYIERTKKEIIEKTKKEVEYIGLCVTMEEIKSRIRIFRKNDKEWRINPFSDYFDIDTLYDLIKANLVVKE